MKTLRILLADDHTLVRAGISSLLAQLPGVTVVAEASDGREVLKLAGIHKPEIVVMDVAMPGLNGLEATLRLLKQFPRTRVVMLSMHANEEYIHQAFQAGASAYLLKKSAVAELEAAVQAAQAGKTYLSPALARHYKPQDPSRPGDSKPPAEKLTTRQREILQLIAESRTTKEIAHELGLSAKTVEFHRAQLMQRLDIHDVPGLVRFALRSGLVESES